MEENPETIVPDTSSASNPEIVAEYRFIITFETYPDEDGVPDVFPWELMDPIRKALAKEFSDYVEFLFNGMVQVRIGPLEQGSILGSVVLILGRAITAADFFSKYKDFYDSLVLLRSQLRAVLNGVLNRILPSKLYRTVNITYIPGPATRVVPIIQRVPPQTVIPAFYSKTFFIYLLVMNIVLTGILIALVYRAVVAMYFGTP
jgi:hypothetical protein